MASSNREEVYKNILLSVHALTQLAGICHKITKTPTDEVGEQLIEIIDNCENKFLKVKEEIVKMVAEIENEQEVTGVQTESGFLIKEKEQNVRV